jgi:Outer membrane protein beta-barrel domain
MGWSFVIFVVWFLGKAIMPRLADCWAATRRTFLSLTLILLGDSAGTPLAFFGCTLPRAMPRRISKGISMSDFKSVITLCVLLLFMTITHEYASAQSNESKVEVGAQFSVLGGGSGFWIYDPTSVGGGGRLTFNLTRYLALEGELNYFPSAGFNDTRRFQGQFGIKSGLRFDRFGVFGKVRPGFLHTDYNFQVICNESPCISINGNNKFSLDVGGVFEFYPSRRMIVRFDAGDTIVNSQTPYLFIDRLYGIPGGSHATHNLQLSAGVGFRF